MSPNQTYNLRTGRDEIFVSAPGDEIHQQAFDLVAPGSVFDSLLEEWRVRADGQAISDLLANLERTVNQISSQTISDQFKSFIDHEFGYASVTEDEGAESQIDSLRECGIPDEKIFLDRLSGRYPQRPKLVECLEQINEGDTLNVWNLVNLARSLKQLGETAEIIQTKKCHLKSISENIDTKKLEHEHFLQNIIFAAGFEKQANSVRTKAGIKEASRQGRKKGGRPSSLTKEKIEFIVKLILDGMPMSKIAELAETSRATIYRHIPGAPDTVFDAHAQFGLEGVNELVDRAVGKLKIGVTQLKREEVVRLYKLNTNVEDIASYVQLNRETVRAIIESAYK